MKNLKRSFAYLCITMLLIGCVGESWVNLDNSKAEDTKLKQALIKCKYDDKRYNLNEEQRTISYMIYAAKLEGKAKESWEEFSKNKETLFDKEMNECMEKYGFKNK